MSRIAPPLAVFDIDGTLTETADVDEECYAEAVKREWGITGISTDWSAYEHSTDNAIADEICRVHRGRNAQPIELERLRDRFAAMIAEERATHPERFRPVGGAVDVFARLRAEGWGVAIATGGWTPSARIKLAAAGIDAGDIPAAFACDARSREEIIRIAIERARRSSGCAYADVVYVGDGQWDLRATRNLRIGFVGRGADARADRLTAAGAEYVLAHFERQAEVTSALAHALRRFA